MTLLKYKSVYVVFLVIKIVGYTKMLQQMYDYWIFIRLIVTEISGQRKLQATDQNGLAEAALEKSIQHPLWNKAALFHNGQLLVPHKTCWYKGVDIQNNQLAFFKVSLLAKWFLKMHCSAFYETTVFVLSFVVCLTFVVLLHIKKSQLEQQFKC